MSGGMYGLTVRWSLAQADPGAAQRLRDYVVGTSLARFSAMEGLAVKTWRMRPGEWFEGCYVFATQAARDGFEASFREQAPTSPGSALVGAPPVLIEPCEIVAMAEGRAGFVPGPGPG